MGGIWEAQMFREAVRPIRAASLCSRMVHPCAWGHSLLGGHLARRGVPGGAPLRKGRV